MGVQNILYFKRGQISVFIILGLLIFVVIILIFLNNKDFASFVLGKSPVDSIEECTTKTINEGKEILSKQGGLITPENYYLYQNNKLHYICYTQESFQNCVMQTPFLKYTIETELKNYLEPRLNECLTDIKLSVERQGNQMRYKKPAIDISLEPNSIISNIELELAISKNDNTESYKNIKTDQNSRLYDMVIVASEIANSEAQYGDSNTDAFMYKDKNLKVEKIKEGDETKVYILTDRKEGEKFIFAVKSIPIPPGWIENV